MTAWEHMTPSDRLEAQLQFHAPAIRALVLELIAGSLMEGRDTVDLAVSAPFPIEIFRSVGIRSEWVEAGIRLYFTDEQRALWLMELAAIDAWQSGA